MQDRFKFRAINMRTKEITYIDSFYWFEEEGVCEIDHNNTGSGSFAEYWINQCTGLKDKNGKLIYEGDILNYSCLPGYSDIYTCTFNNGSFLIGGLLISNTHLKSEVIGNIYENPELLEVEE